MLVKVLKKRLGTLGEVTEIPERAARVLILLGYVSKVEEPKRQYMRRDMQAESGESAPRKRRKKAA